MKKTPPASDVLARHRKVIRRFTDQAAELPADVRRLLRDALDGAPPTRYAFLDLDPAGARAEAWVASASGRMAVARREAGDAWRVESCALADIEEVRERTGLSSTTLLVTFHDPGRRALQLVYTNRQRKAVGAVRLLLDGAAAARGPNADTADAVYAEAVASAIEEAQSSVIVNRRAVVWRLLGYLRPYRAVVAAGMAAAAAVTLVNLVPPYLTGRLIDRVLRPFQNGQLPADAARRLALLILGGIVATYGIRLVATWVRLRTMAFIGEWVARDLRDDLFAHLQRLGIPFFSRRQTGSIISRVSSDTDRIWDFVAFGVVELSLSALQLIGLTVVLLRMDWRLGLLVSIPVPLFFLGILRNGRTMRRIFLRAWRKWSDLTDVLSDVVPGIRVVKAFHQEEAESRRFTGRNRSVTVEFNRVHRVWTRFWPLLMLGVNVLSILVWAFALPRLLGGGFGPPLTTGTFVSFLLYLGLFYEPIHTFGHLNRTLNRATSSAHRVFELMDTRPRTAEGSGRRLERLRGEVRFENVTFSYDGIRPVIMDLSFDAAPGEMIGLVGPSGAGKTTITHLLARFYEVGSGRILVDGIDLRELELGSYRRHVGMVMQDPYLFSGSILDNIRYGMPEATLEQVLAAARAANAHDFICRLPFGYDTRVGERGHTLSGGERQRVSIARAVLHDPQILILDEATSSVDTETERKIQDALDRLVRNRTVIAVAHRLSTLKRARRLLVIKEGRILEQGTHEELLAVPDGLYRKLYEMQQERGHIVAV